MNSIRITSRGFLLCSAAMFWAVQPAHAQVQEEQPAPQAEQPAPQVDASATDVDGGEIVITAQKREERILDIPQSVTVVGGDTLERQHSTTFEQYQNEIPGLSVTQDEPGEARIVLRGVNTSGVSSTVAVYVDETPFGSSTALVNGAILAGDFDPFDIARIEVLRGPQGTLYGASSLGGVFKFVTNAPRLGEFTARGRAGVEFVDDGGTGYNANAVVNVPLGAIAAFRATGTFRKEAGWVDADPAEVTIPGLNIPLPPPFDPFVVPDLTITSLDDKNINDNKVWSGRASLLVQPSDPLSIRLTAHAQNMRTHGSASVDVEEDTYDPLRSNFGSTVFIPEFSDIDYRVYSADVEYDFGFASLLSATSYGKSTSAFRLDASLILAGDLNLLFGPQNPEHPLNPLLGLPAERLTDQPILSWLDQVTSVKKFTQEFRLSSPSNDTFEWMVGGYYTHEDGLIDQEVDGATQEATPLTEPFNDLLISVVDSKYKELAGFANVTWHVTDRFDISGGGRLSRNKQQTTQILEGTLGGGEEFEPGKSSEDVFTYSLAPRYELSDNTAIYARVAKGYRPGGPNAIPPLAPEGFPTSFDADTLTSYELGLKTDIGRRMSLDVAAYHLDWKDVQLIGSLDNFNFNANGEGARVNGLEASLTARPVRGLRLSANAALTDAELTDDTAALVGGLDGDRLPYSPKVSFAVNGDYEWDIAATTTAFVGASLRWAGTQRGEFRSQVVGVDGNGVAIFEPLPQRHIPDYATLDLRGGVDFGQFTLEAYVRNVTGSDGITQVNEGPGLPGTGITAAFLRPRTIGFTLGAKL